MKPRSNDSANKRFVLRTLHKIVADITFLETFFIIHFLVRVADCGYVHLFCSYLSKNEAVKLSFTSFVIYFSCWPSIMQYQSDFLKNNTHSHLSRKLKEACNDGQWLFSKSMLTDSFEHAQKYKTPDQLFNSYLFISVN